MKKTILILVALTLMVGCSGATSAQVENENAVTYTASTYITDEMYEQTKGKIYVNADIEGKTLSQWANDNAEYAVLATVISNDSAVTSLPSGMKDELGFTLGKILVQETYKGKNLDNQVLNTIKLGGIITQKQVDDVSDPEALSKREYLRNNNGGANPEETYINTTIEQDIMLEEGKTYFMLLHYVEEEQRYQIVGFNVGTREAQIPKPRSIKKENFDNVRVKNNETGKFESIENILEQIK